MLGQRIRIARQSHGLSQRRLAEDVGVSVAAVSKWEAEKLTPSSDRLLALAQALGVRTEFFFRPATARLERPEYRKRSRLPKKELLRIEASVLDRAERMLEILALYPRPPLSPFESPSGLPEGGSLDDLEGVAEALREAWDLGLDPISDLTATLEDRGILVFSCRIDAKRRFDGLACHVGEWPVIVVGEEWPGDRQRFTLAHELGHLVLPGLIPQNLDVEKACNRFAGAFLAPASAVRGSLGSRRSRIEVRELYDLKLQFGLSMSALLYRARDLDIVDAAFYEKTMRTFSKRGWRRQEPGEPIPPESPRFFEQLVYHALAESFIGEAKAAELLGSSLTEFQKHRRLEAVHAAPGE